MKLGICTMADIDEIGFFPHAENLGYDSVWVTDSQMLFSDCYAVLSRAAEHTSRLRIGPGVAICPTRIPPVHVAAIATLNRMAPGRVHLGIGTGNTAQRSMGQRPMRITEFEEYLRVLSALLRGETVDYTQDGVTRPIRILMHDDRYMNLEPPIPLYVSGFGPRAMGLAGAYGDGLVFAIPPRGVPVAEALAHARQGAARVGRLLGTGPAGEASPQGGGESVRFRSCALANMLVLEPGERKDSERVIRTIGPNVMASVYYFYDEVHERGIDPPPFLEPIWDRYCALLESTPPEHRHLRTHEYHYTRLHEGEAELMTPELIDATCIVGPPEEIIERVRALESEGLEELMFATGVPEKWRQAEDFSRLVMRRL